MFLHVHVVHVLGCLKILNDSLLQWRQGFVFCTTDRLGISDSIGLAWQMKSSIISTFMPYNAKALQASSIHCTFYCLFTERHSSVHFFSIQTPLCFKIATNRVVGLVWKIFRVTDRDVFICTGAVINGNPSQCYFSGVLCAGVKWSSPCEIGSR